MSWADVLLRYARTRLHARVLVPAVVLLLLTATLAAVPGDWPELGRRALLAVTLFTLFRLLDDIASRESDGRLHRERVIVLARSLAPFHAAALGLATLAAVVLARGANAMATLGGLATLTAATLVWYRVHAGLPALVDTHVVLLKYPVFVWLLAGSGGAVDAPRLALGMAITYLATAVYDQIDDPNLRPQGSPVVLALDISALATTVLMAAGVATGGLR